MDVGEHSRAVRPSRSGEEVIQIAIRLGLLAFLIYWSFVLLRPFIPILAWAAVLAVALNPAYDWLSAHLGHRPRTGAFIMTSPSWRCFSGRRPGLASASSMDCAASPIN